MNSTIIFALAAVLVLLGAGLLWLSRPRRTSDGDEVFSPDTQAGSSEAVAASAASYDASSESLSPASRVKGGGSDVVSGDADDTSVRLEGDGGEAGGFAAGLRSRKDRRDWAKTHGYDFGKKDHYLVDEWSDGAIVLQGPARDLVSGSFRGREFHVADVGDRTVMAMRRPAASSIEVDIRREGAAGVRQDCHAVTVVNGWRISSTDPQSAARMIDVRVQRALRHLPDSVTGMWVQSQWVIVGLTGSTSTDWDELLIPLADMSDAAMMLPLFSPQPLDRYDDEHDPTRADVPPIIMRDDSASGAPHSVSSPPASPGDDGGVEVEFPSRTQAETHGTVGDRPVGIDEVAPIAHESMTGRTPEFDGRTAVRTFNESSTIFDDISAELGTNPLAEESGSPDKPE